MNFKLLSGALLVSFFGVGQSFATPILSDSLINTQLLDFSEGLYISNTSEDSYYSSSKSGSSAYGDFNSGKVGAISSTDIQAVVQTFDVLTFDRDTTVSFDFTLDGILSSDSVFGSTYGAGAIYLYDITGLSSWLETSTILDLWDTVSISESAELLSLNSVVINLDEIRGSTTEGGDFSIEQELARDGTMHDVTYSMSGNIGVSSTKEYGILLATTAYSSEDGGIADFSNTGTFSFTDLGGASFTSASGSFLNTQQISVPEPSSILLFGLALSGVVFSRKKNHPALDKLV